MLVGFGLEIVVCGLTVDKRKGFSSKRESSEEKGGSGGR